jgi:hypothetical protein
MDCHIDRCPVREVDASLCKLRDHRLGGSPGRLVVEGVLELGQGRVDLGAP